MAADTDKANSRNDLTHLSLTCTQLMRYIQDETNGEDCTVLEKIPKGNSNVHFRDEPSELTEHSRTPSNLPPI